MLKSYIREGIEKKVKIAIWLFLGALLLVSIPEVYIYRGVLEKNVGVSFGLIAAIVFIITVGARLFFGFSVGGATFKYCLFVLAPLLPLLAVFFTLVDFIMNDGFVYGAVHISPDALIDISFYFLLFTALFFEINVIKKYWRMTIFVLGIIFFCFYVFMKWRFPDIFYMLDNEDSIIEYAQFILFFAASALSTVSFFLTLKLKLAKRVKILWVVLLGTSAAVLFLFAGEEISWGQRIFDIQTPEFLTSINQQNEITIHNTGTALKFVYEIYLFIGYYGLLSWLIFYIPIKIYGVRLSEYIRPVLSRWYLMPYFLVIIGYIYWRFTSTNGSFDVWEEAAELFFAMGIFLIFIRCFFYIKNKKIGEGVGDL